MAYEFANLHIDDDSPEGRALSRLMAHQSLTPEDAVRVALRQALETKTPAEEMIGLFSSPEDLAVFEEGMALAKDPAHAWNPRDLDL